MQVVELALGCVHKLVSHAWLHGESSVFEGLMDDGSDVVSQVHWKEGQVIRPLNEFENA